MVRHRRPSVVSVCVVIGLASAAASAQGDAEFRRAEWRAWFERRWNEESARLRADLVREFESRFAGGREGAHEGAAAGLGADDARARIAALEAENAALRARLRAAEAAAGERPKAGRQIGPPPSAPPPPRASDADADGPVARLRGLRARIAALEARGVSAEKLAPLKESADALAREIGVDAATPPSSATVDAPSSDPRPRFLGVYPGPVAAEWSRRFGAPEGVGVRVVDVVPDSPAAAAGLRKDDVLLTVDGAAVRDEADLRAKLAASRGASVRLTFRRGAAALEASAVFAPSETSRAADPEREAEFRRVFEGAVRMAVGDEPAYGAPASRPSPGGG
jgi:hypothetical protein